jgi:hypothetical protein
LAEETEGACFGADFSSVHSQNDSRICLNSLARKKSSLQICYDFALRSKLLSLLVICDVNALQHVINCDSALPSQPLSLLVI